MTHTGTRSAALARRQVGLAHLFLLDLDPIERAPFYGVRVLPGSFGTYAGLTTDPSGDGRAMVGATGPEVTGEAAVAAIRAEEKAR